MHRMRTRWIFIYKFYRCFFILALVSCKFYKYNIILFLLTLGIDRFDTVTDMSSSGLLISNLRDRSTIKDNKQFRKRPKSCDEVLMQLNTENIYIPPSALPETSTTSSSEYRCLCAPTTHAGSFRCRLHRASFQKQSASTEPRLPPSMQTLPLPSPKNIVPLKRIVGSKHGRRDASALISFKAADSKLSRLSKMATCSQMDCDTSPTEGVMNGPTMDNI
jgi:hypothetical protein